MTTSARADEIAALYNRHANRLHHSVSKHVNTSEPTIQDACQSAWTILLRRPDVSLDERGVAWLATVAIHEAWRLASTARETPAGDFHATTSGHDLELPEPADPDEPSAEQRALARIEHQARIGILKTLKPREREALYLHGLGYSYAEVATLTNSTLTAVNRRITEGRAALRNGGRDRQAQ